MCIRDSPYSIFGRIMYVLAWPAAIWSNNLLAADSSSADLEVVPDEEYSDKFNQIPLSLAVKLDKNAVLHDLLPVSYTHLDVYKRQQ